MDRSETLIKEHLEMRGFSDIVYEPDGNVPPDFLVDRQIAIEVRRLNQGFVSGSRVLGLEESAYPLCGKITSLLNSFGPPRSGASWFVLHHFSRPIPTWKQLKSNITELCREVAVTKDHLPPGSRLVAKVHENFELDFLKASEPHESMFLMGGYSDGDCGGAVLSEMDRNLQQWITEKTDKIKKYRHKYNRWWLAFVDYIGYGLSREDQEMIKCSTSVQHTWDKILIVSPLNLEKYFEL